LKEKLVGVYWGRFNPPHKGHLEMIKSLSKKVKTVIVVIGSSEFKNEKRNPFSGAERKQMLLAYIKEAKIKNVKVVTHKDKGGYFWSLSKLITGYKPNVLFFPKNEKPELLRLAKEKFKNKVSVVTFKRTGSLSSTRLRNAIASNKKWEHLTGKSVIRLIIKFNGTNRIKRTYKNSKK